MSRFNSTTRVLLLSLFVFSTVSVIAGKKHEKQKLFPDYPDEKMKREGFYGYLPKNPEDMKMQGSDGEEFEKTEYEGKYKTLIKNANIQNREELKQFLLDFKNNNKATRKGGDRIKDILANLNTVPNTPEACSKAAWRCLDGYARTYRRREYKNHKSSSETIYPVKNMMIGPLGIHVDFDENSKLLVVNRVEEKAPAAGIMKVGDMILGSGRTKFVSLDKFHYGEATHFRPRCRTVVQLADAIDRAEATGKLNLIVARKRKRTSLNIPLRKIGRYSPTYPFNCEKSAIIRERACEHLLKAYKAKVWGPHGVLGDEDRKCGAQPYETGLCGLALMAQKNREKYWPVIKDLAEGLCEHPIEQVYGGEYLTHTYITLFLCEYYLATKDMKVKRYLEKIYQYYLDGAQPYGGWGHRYRKGIYGLGGYAVSTGHVVMAMGMLSRCIKLNQKRMDQTLTHLLAPYEDGAIAYMGNWKINPEKANIKPEEIRPVGDGPARTGPTALGMSLMKQDPYNILPTMLASLGDPKSYVRYYLPHCCHVIGQFPCSVAVARDNPKAFRAHMDMEKWWYTLGRRYDGELLLGPIFKKRMIRNTFQKKYYLMAANACVALIHSVDQRMLYMFKKVKPYTSLKNMTLYRQWNNWLLNPASTSKEGKEKAPVRPCVANPPARPKPFPSKVPRLDQPKPLEGYANQDVVFEGEIVSREWKGLLRVRHLENGSIYWVGSSLKETPVFLDGKVLATAGEKLAGAISKSERKDMTSKMEEAKRVRVTADGKNYLQFIRAKKLEFFSN